ncbi:uncharacterized protein LOC133161256 [Syngnathus typhle]|uniref:uncharacterized protein LOC133161256 n=1 Tax=Syngnathus typhle TaxID=161592 RepID=UPI002A6B27F1|nr:uncharacterized protein LOC133161256 [Syngnathus typhle]
MCFTETWLNDLSANSHLWTVFKCCGLTGVLRRAVRGDGAIPDMSALRSVAAPVTWSCWWFQTQHPQSLLLISRDFNHASLASSLPAFTKYVDCPTRNVKDACTSSPLPPLGSLDHNLVHLVADYCVETTVPSKLVRCFPNNKPWVSSEIKGLLNGKKRAFGSGDVVELRRIQKEVRLKIRQGKENYGRRLEKQMGLNNARNIWRGLQSISGHGKGADRKPANGDKDWADELNLFFNRFYSASPPPLNLAPHLILPPSTLHTLLTFFWLNVFSHT